MEEVVCRQNDAGVKVCPSPIHDHYDCPSPVSANAAVFAIQNATTEGKITVIVLLVLSLFSWTIIITKFRQIMIARGDQKIPRSLCLHARPAGHPRKGEEFDGAPAYQLYIRGADELAYHLKNNPVEVQAAAKFARRRTGNTDHLARQYHQDQPGVV